MTLPPLKNNKEKSQEKDRVLILISFLRWKYFIEQMVSVKLILEDFYNANVRVVFICKMLIHTIFYVFFSNV